MNAIPDWLDVHIFGRALRIVRACDWRKWNGSDDKAREDQDHERTDINLQIPILYLQALMLLIVVALCYAIFLIGRRASRAKAENIENIFSLKPGAVSREIKLEFPPGSSGAQVIGQTISVLQRQGARTLRQDSSQAVMYFGSRIRAKMWGIRFADPVTWPTRVLARAEVENNAMTLHVRLDEDYGYQMFIGSWFQDGYSKVFAAVVGILEKELGPSNHASTHPL